MRQRWGNSTQKQSTLSRDTKLRSDNVSCNNVSALNAGQNEWEQNYKIPVHFIF